MTAIIECTTYDEDMNVTRAELWEYPMPPEGRPKDPIFAATSYAPVSDCRRFAATHNFTIESIRYK
jgi:hypothetical protein